MDLIALRSIATGSGQNRKTISSGDRFNTDDYPAITQAEWTLWLHRGVVRLPRNRARASEINDAPVH